jgi:cobalt-zinc-cadmium efflux system membrane fusion protein
VRLVRSTVLEATGTLAYDADAVAMVGPKAEGRIVRVVHDLGERVGRGEALALLESQEVGDLHAELARARAAAAVARRDYERERSLYEQEVSSEKEMLEARAAYESAVADTAAATAKLRTLGALDRDGTGFQVSTPVAGTVVERDAVVGQIVGADDQLFTVADLTRLWLIVDIYEKDLARVRAGLDVEIRTRAFPDTVFHGEVTYLGQVVDPDSHTVKARVVADNPGGLLRPGMFVRAGIVLPEPMGTLAVPRAAVQTLRDTTVVFVPEGEGRFRAVPVRTGAQVGDGLVVLAAGVPEGQPVVGAGSFFLKSELLKATFGDID